MAEVEAAKAHGRQLITDAQALRERVLADLSRRRNAGRAQIEQLREGRDRLLGAYEVVQRTVDHAVEQLRLAAPDAHAVIAPDRVALPAAPDIEEPVVEEPEGVRVLTPPAPPEPEVAAETDVVPDVVVEEIVVEEIVVEEVVVDGIVVDEIVEVIVVEAVVDDVTEETPVVPGDPTLDERTPRTSSPTLRLVLLVKLLRRARKAPRKAVSPMCSTSGRPRWPRSRRRWPASCAGRSRTSRTRCSTGFVRARSSQHSMTWSEGQPSTARATPSPPGATSPERPAPDPSSSTGCPTLSLRILTMW